MSQPEGAESALAPVGARTLVIDGAEWRCWPSGSGAYGTGVLGLGVVEAVHFAAADAATVPLFEALLPAGVFWNLFDAELVSAFRDAKRVVEGSEAPARPASRRLGDQS